MPRTRTHGLLLGNRSEVARRQATFPVVNPADGTLVANVVQADPHDAAAGMEAAAAAQPKWEALGAAARAKILLRGAERLRSSSTALARLVTQEMGKVLTESSSEVLGAIDNFDYYASFARTLVGDEVAGLPFGKSLRLTWVPRGVVVAITPWNFPAATVTRKIAPALVGGNTMVLKPSSATPLSSLYIAKALVGSGLPPGVLNVVCGPGGTLGPALIQHPTCSTVTLTGSTSSGVEVLKLAAPRVVKCLLELGGKAPVIIEPDADLDWAARATVWARYWNAGQACIAAERAFLHREVAQRFTKKLVTLVRSLRVGPGLSPNVDIGPVYSRAARDAIARDVVTAKDGGAQVEVGGEVPTSGVLGRGAFYAPTVLSSVNDTNPIAREEVFGPVLPLLEYKSFDEAIERANDSIYGLSSYVFTRNVSHAEKAARLLRFGETYINQVGPESPQGYHAGFRQSGLGGEGSRWGVTDYLQLKSVYVDYDEPHRADYFLPYAGRGRPA